MGAAERAAPKTLPEARIRPALTELSARLGAHLAAELPPGSPPAAASIDAAYRHFTGEPAELVDIWWAWREIERLRLAIGTRDLDVAIEAAIISGRRLATHLPPGFPSANSPMGHGLVWFGGAPCPAFNLWMGWRSIDRLREAVALGNEASAG